MVYLLHNSPIAAATAVSEEFVQTKIKESEERCMQRLYEETEPTKITLARLQDELEKLKARQLSSDTWKGKRKERVGKEKGQILRERYM